MRNHVNTCCQSGVTCHEVKDILKGIGCIRRGEVGLVVKESLNGGTVMNMWMCFVVMVMMWGWMAVVLVLLVLLLDVVAVCDSIVDRWYQQEGWQLSYDVQWIGSGSNHDNHQKKQWKAKYQTHLICFVPRECNKEQRIKETLLYCTWKDLWYAPWVWLWLSLMIIDLIQGRTVHHKVMWMFVIIFWAPY